MNLTLTDLWVTGDTLSITGGALGTEKYNYKIEFHTNHD